MSVAACADDAASAPTVASKAHLPCELWGKGSKVDALDVAGMWYEAKVVDERGQGDTQELLVHYKGWKPRFDEWLGVGSSRLRAAGGELGPCKHFAAAAAAAAAAAEMEAGSIVDAQDPLGTWYKASVVGERGADLSRELLVHYSGWNRRLDEWLGVTSGRLRAAGGELGPCKPVAVHDVEDDGQHRRAPAPNTTTGDSVTAVTRFPSAPAPDPAHSQPLESPDCLTGQWLGVPTEHFGTLSLGFVRYLGKVAREEDDNVFFWLVCDGNEHCAPRLTVRKWLIPVEEMASAVKGMLRTNPSEQARAPVSVLAPAVAPARTAAATAAAPTPAPAAVVTAPKPAPASAAAVTTTALRPAPAAAVAAVPSSKALPKQLKRAAERFDSADDLASQWIGIPTEHFKVASGGGRYLGQVKYRKGKSDSVWYTCDGLDYHDDYTKVREWVISDKEARRAKDGQLGPSAASAGTVTTTKTVSRVPAGTRAAPTPAAAPTAAPKQLKRAAERFDSADDLASQWIGIPTEHFKVASGGGRYLGQVKYRKGKSDSVWYTCDGLDYHDDYTKVREWVISEEEAIAPVQQWYTDPVDSDDNEHMPEARDSSRSRADGQQAKKRARPNTSRAPAATVAHDEEPGADFSAGTNLDEAQPIRAPGRQRKATQRQSRAEARQDGWKGKPISKGADGELFYTQLCVDGENFHVGDTVFVRGEGESEAPRAWLCRIDSFWESMSGDRCFEGRWYYHPEETCAGRLQGHDGREIFQTEHCTEQQPVEVIDGQCDVLSWDLYQEWLDQPEDDGDDHTYICRASYHPGTSEFRPLVGASSLAEAVRVSIGGGYAEGESSQAELPAPALQRKARLSRFAQAAERLTPSAAPERMPGREKELDEVTCSLRGAICEGGLGASLYLSGTPGTGKTATVHQALRQLASEKDLPAFRTVEMNGMKLSSPYQVRCGETNPPWFLNFRSCRPHACRCTVCCGRH